MPNLYLSLKHLPENLPEGYTVNRFAWGSMELSYDDGFDQTTLFSIESHLKDFTHWFAVAHLRRAYDDFGLRHCLENESIAQAFAQRNLQQTTAYAVFTGAHCLRNPFFHSAICPHIYLALRKPPNEGELSLAHPLRDYSKIKSSAKIAYPEPDWAYRFDLKNYLHDARLEVARFMEEWHESMTDKLIQTEIARYLRLLLDTPE